MVMDHAELVLEMRHIENLTNQERLSLARQRRAAQLRAWSEREYILQTAMKNERINNHIRSINSTKRRQSKCSKIRFVDSAILLEAASRNDIIEVRKLLLKGVSPDSTNTDGLTALHQCCIDDNEEMMKLLLEFGADVNAVDSEKWTPLHAAATCGHLHLVKHLIANGADLLAVNACGNMPYDICEEDTCLEYIESEMAHNGITQALIDETRALTETEMLLDLKYIAEQMDNGLEGDLEYQSENGASPLHIAAANGYIRVIEFLMERRVHTDVRDNDDWAPVHAAACWGHLDVLELLAHHGADLGAKTKYDETPSDICEEPVIRERIIELRLEQEVARRRTRTGVGLRRTQSQPKRAQSVRRTSLRERGLTAAKRDARLEASLLRFQQHIRQDSDSEMTNRDNKSVVDDHVNPSNCIANRKEPDGKDSESCFSSLLGDYLQNQAESVTSLEVPAEASYTEESNGKINIHVSVTINAGTLAELKRQRAQNRVASPDNSIQLDLLQISSGQMSLYDNLSDHMASNTVMKFSGDISENTVGDRKLQRCCNIF